LKALGKRRSVRNHHFVPQFLLRPWQVDGVLHGYYWHQWKDALACKRKSPRAFCSQLDLLTLHSRRIRRDALETVFFGDIDTRGALVRDLLLENGADPIASEQRSEFARLLLSLDLRRPAAIERLRANGHRTFVEGLDNDPALVAELAKGGIEGPPSRFAEEYFKTSLEDRALLIVQNMVDNREIGGRLINAHWHVARIPEGNGTLILADRPLIRIFGYDHPKAVWLLPLTPTAVFVAANDAGMLRTIRRFTPQRLVKNVNGLSVVQAERFVFLAEKHHERWIGRYLREFNRLRN
jgi:hypothetical protein